MSSPAPRRSQRNSMAPTPSRTNRSSQQMASSPTTAVASTPQPPQSSPLFFRSSPVNRVPNAPVGNQLANMSSPLRQASTVNGTPRGRAAPVADSSPIRYASSSSPSRANGNGNHLPDIPSSSSGLFVRSSRANASGTPGLNNSRRGDIHSDVFGSTPSRRRRMFVDENGLPVREGAPNSDAPTFSNLDPTTSEADAIGGSSTRVIWGTSIAIQDTMSSFRQFLLGFQKKYRMWADGMSEADVADPESGGNDREYVGMLNDMRHLGVSGLNLDLRNLKAFPTTSKLWQQLQSYPHEIVPLMDQTVKDIMVDLAEEEMTKLRAEQQQQLQARARSRPDSSMPAVPSSEANVRSDQAAPIPDLVQEAETRIYKVKPFGLESSINMRDLNPNGTNIELLHYYRAL